MTRRVVKLDLASGEPVEGEHPFADMPLVRQAQPVFIRQDEPAEPGHFTPAEPERLDSPGVDLAEADPDDWADATPWVVSSNGEAIVFRSELDALRAVATLVTEMGVVCKPVTFGEVV